MCKYVSFFPFRFYLLVKLSWHASFRLSRIQINIDKQECNPRTPFYYEREDRTRSIIINITSFLLGGMTPYLLPSPSIFYHDVPPCKLYSETRTRRRVGARSVNPSQPTILIVVYHKHIPHFSVCKTKDQNGDHYNYDPCLVH